jgi:hypothetical protein
MGTETKRAMARKRARAKAVRAMAMVRKRARAARAMATAKKRAMARKRARARFALSNFLLSAIFGIHMEVLDTELEQIKNKITVCLCMMTHPCLTSLTMSE